MILQETETITDKTHLVESGETEPIQVSLLSGGADRPYAFGLATELLAKRVTLDIIGNDDLDSPEFHGKPGVRFLNLRGEQRPDAGVAQKIQRVLVYYIKLIRYAFASKPCLFHILWNNKFESFDRTALMLYYKMLGKKVVLTAHNVNAGRRDKNDSLLNRLTLKAQYRLADHIFVHADKMKQELVAEFGVQAARVSVIPFGINNAVPHTSLTSSEAKKRLGLDGAKKTILFFGNIAPYKGLEYLVEAFQSLSKTDQENEYQLVIAGRAKNCPEYWAEIQRVIGKDAPAGITVHERYIPDEETEIYFKAADVLILPYRHIYQSGVLFLGYSFGLPVLASDVGSLKEEIMEGETGYLFRPDDPGDLAKCIQRYFASELFANLETRRQRLIEFANERYSWDKVGRITMAVYADLSQIPSQKHVRQPKPATDRTTSS